MSLDEMAMKLSLLFPIESVGAGLRFEPEPTDLIISPLAKCGTTWLQQIVHGLRTGGDMDFDEISRVVPWIETAHSLGIDLDAEQRARPRAFKSHLPWEFVPKGGRYIVSFRDPRDALVSFYRFMEGWVFEPGAISMDDLARARFLNRDPFDYWAHLAGWWSQRDNPNVLLLTFESLKQNLPDMVRRIASFAGIDTDDELLEIATRQASYAFMKEHKDRFSDRLTREYGEAVAGLPVGGDSAKIRKGKVGEHRAELSAEILSELDARWESDIAQKLGLSTYQDVIDALA